MGDLYVAMLWNHGQATGSPLGQGGAAQGRVGERAKKSEPSTVDDAGRSSGRL